MQWVLILMRFRLLKTGQTSVCAIGGDYSGCQRNVNVNKLRLEISVPQIAIKSNPVVMSPLNVGMKGSTRYYWEFV